MTVKGLSWVFSLSQWEKCWNSNWYWMHFIHHAPFVFSWIAGAELMWRKVHHWDSSLVSSRSKSTLHFAAQTGEYERLRRIMNAKSFVDFMTITATPGSRAAHAQDNLIRLFAQGANANRDNLEISISHSLPDKMSPGRYPVKKIAQARNLPTVRLRGKRRWPPLQSACCCWRR